MAKIVSVTGNIAAGTTTLVARLSRLMEWKAIFSEVSLMRSPFYSKFLQDPPRWAFHNQIFFLHEYVEAHRNFTESVVDPDGVVLQDYTVFEIPLYTEVMMRRQFLSPDEYSTISNVFDSCSSVLRIPDLLIYVTAPIDELMERISTRRRTHEELLDRQYLQDLQSGFDNLVQRWSLSPKFTINSAETNFRDDETIVRKIAADITHLLGLSARNHK